MSQSCVLPEGKYKYATVEEARKAKNKQNKEYRERDREKYNAYQREWRRKKNEEIKHNEELLAKYKAAEAINETNKINNYVTVPLSIPQNITVNPNFSYIPISTPVNFTNVSNGNFCSSLY